MTVDYTEKKRHDLLDPRSWGLPVEGTADLAERLRRIWARFRNCFRTKTRDTSEQALVYMQGSLTMEEKRNYSNIARRVNQPQDDGQNLQQFMSDSPWQARAVFDQIQAEVCQRPELQGGMLTLDESGDKRAGADSAGAARQYLGRLGKVDLGQVGVVLGYYQKNIWLMVDAELYLTEDWFDDQHADLRRRLHIPQERTFTTKIEIGLEMIQRAKANNIPFQVVGCDIFYGRSAPFRAALDAEKSLYLAQIPANTLVCLEKPEIGVPEKPQEHGRGRPPSRPQVINGVQSVSVQELVHRLNLLDWREVEVRPAERGTLIYRCAAQRVWTVDDEGRVREEWLFIMRHEEEENGEHYSYSLSNAPRDTPLETLALWRSMRYFAERIFQDAKSELGWDELVARKYRAWMHHSAMDAVALWFIGETKLDWAQKYPRDPELARRLEVEVLPNLSVANVREMIRATLPLNQLSHEDAVSLVIRHLYNRSRSTRSRLKKQRRRRKQP
jgi:SRSO17 transposase